MSTANVLSQCKAANNLCKKEPFYDGPLYFIYRFARNDEVAIFVLPPHQTAT